MYKNSGGVTVRIPGLLHKPSFGSSSTSRNEQKEGLRRRLTTYLVLIKMKHQIGKLGR